MARSIKPERAFKKHKPGECMNKCVKITCIVKVTSSFTSLIHKKAQELLLEGSLQVVPPETIKIVVCGSKDGIDTFVDLLYKEGASKKQFSLIVEPFLKDKDYRGIFRVII